LADPAVLLLHGFASSVDASWARNGWLDLLADSDRRVIAPDLLGHGTAPKPHEPAAYDAIEGLVQAELEGVGAVDAVGFSMGARVALLIEADRPGTFGRIVVGGLGNNLFAREYDPEPAALAIEGRGEALDPLIRAFASVAATPPNDPLALAACLRRMHRPVLASDLASVRCPVLVVVGADDLVVRPVEPLTDALADASLVTIPGVDHLGTMKGFGFLEAALDFLGVGVV
jgi:pimeloyl-ACP methyl ester carboxylesterase